MSVTINQQIIFERMQTMAPKQKRGIVRFVEFLLKKRPARKVKTQTHPKQTATLGNSVHEKRVMKALERMSPHQQHAVVQFVAGSPKKRLARTAKRPPATNLRRPMRPGGAQRIPNTIPPSMSQPPPSLGQKAALKSLEIPVQTFAFDLLPPGMRDIEHVVDYYRQAIRSGAFARDEIQWERLDKLDSLEPNKYSVGKKGWRGYIVFEFLRSKHVILECPLKGNATYVLSGDWKNMVGHSKLYLRTTLSHHCTKIVHKGEWLEPIEAAL